MFTIVNLKKIVLSISFSQNFKVIMKSSSYSSVQMDAADELVSLSTEAYRDDPITDSDTSTNATTASSDLNDDTSTTSGREGEVSNDVTNSASLSSETVENSSRDESSVETGFYFNYYIQIFHGMNICFILSS